MRKFIVLIPNHGFKKGDIIERLPEEEEFKMPIIPQGYYHLERNLFIPASLMENNPGWFEEIIEGKLSALVKLKNLNSKLIFGRENTPIGINYSLECQIKLGFTEQEINDLKNITYSEYMEYGIF